MSYSSEVLADSPLAYWKLDETSGTSAADSSGNSRTATYGSATSGGTSLLGDGSGQSTTLNESTGAGYLTLASASWMNVSSITVSCLVKITSANDGSNGDAIVSRLSGNFDWVILRDQTGHFEASVWNNVGTRYNAISSSVATSGTIYHVAFTWNGSNLILYVNGTAVATTAVSGTVATLAAPLEIGRYSSASVTVPSGNIDEVAIFGSALSAARIAAHSTAAFSTGVVDATVNAVAATATAAASAPAVSASRTVLAPAATATAAAAAPAVTGTGDGSVNATPATATASALPPTLAADATVLAALAIATADALAPTVSATATIAAPVATATADAVAPFVDDGSGSQTVLAPAATATATALAPTVVQVLPAGTDTTNTANGRDRRARATVTITRPVAAVPATLTLATKVDKAIAYPAPVMVDGRPT